MVQRSNPQATTIFIDTEGGVYFTRLRPLRTSVVQRCAFGLPDLPIREAHQLEEGPDETCYPRFPHCVVADIVVVTHRQLGSGDERGRGTVKTRRARCSGVTVEASSPALIEKGRSSVTDDQGQYRIAELRPGLYTVTFSLTGFGAFKREGLDLPSSFTATLNVELSVGGLQETVTVSGETPLVDVQNVSAQKSIPKAVLDAVPTGKGIYGFVSLMPAAIAPTSNQDVGGSLGDSTMRITVHGSKGDDAKLAIDGLSYNPTNANGTARQFFVNPLSAQEIVIDTGSGGSAEWGVGGAIVNQISRDGGNVFSGTSLVRARSVRCKRQSHRRAPGARSHLGRQDSGSTISTVVRDRSSGQTLVRHRTSPARPGRPHRQPL